MSVPLNQLLTFLGNVISVPLGVLPWNSAPRPFCCKESVISLRLYSAGWQKNLLIKDPLPVLWPVISESLFSEPLAFSSLYPKS